MDLRGGELSDDDDTACSDNEGIIHVDHFDDSTVDIVHDSCRDVSSRYLSNICKFLINQTVNKVTSNPRQYYDYLRLWIGRAKEPFKKVYQICRILKTECKKQGRGALRKDYIEVVKKFGERFAFHVTFNLVMGEILNNLARGNKGRIKDQNVETYKQVIRNIYQYSCGKLNIVPFA